MKDIANTNVDRQWLKFKTVPGRIVLFEATVSPGSAVTCVRGVYGTTLKIAVQSPPDKGKANAEVTEVVADLLGIRKHQVRVVAGQTSRKKRIQVKGMLGRDFRNAIARQLER